MFESAGPLFDENAGGLVVRERSRLPNRSLIEPLTHGDGCVGLSGLFSIANGIRLVLADRCLFDGPAVHDLLNTGLRFMDGRLTPTQVATSGLRAAMWRQLAEAMTAQVRFRHRALVFAERVYVDGSADRSAGWAVIEQNVRARRAVLLLMRGGRYTVVSGYTPSSLLLFDSGWAQWIRKHATGVPGDASGARHIIYPSSFMVMRA